MQIKGSKVLILGGWGLVGSAIVRKLASENPSEIIISSLKESEAKEAVNEFKAELSANIKLTPKWGNIFTRTEWKDVNPKELYTNSKYRKDLIKDIFLDLDEPILENSFLYNLIQEVKPDLVIDCINTATGIAYLDIYKTSLEVISDLENDNLKQGTVEQLVASSYVPQLIRHIQILSRGLSDVNANMYLKIGTTGTGGMGMNIPYTHSEDRPSRVLMSKTAVAGAQTMLLYLLARTPNGPIYKEIKPAATIAWKKIAYGEIKKGGLPIKLVDMDLSKAGNVNDVFDFEDIANVSNLNRSLSSVFIDTGENGIFSKGEFEAISSIGQMELVTPEEIADYTVFEILGGNTGKDIIQGIDAFAMGPTYRGGALRERALNKISEIEKENNVESVAFELLGPPRLSKLLYEAHICKKLCGSLKQLCVESADDLSVKAQKLVEENQMLRSQILSIGLPILLNENKYLRGDFVKIPVRKTESKLNIDEKNLNLWTFQGWIDLRPSNFENWINRAKAILNQSKAINDTSSRYVFNSDFWENYDSIPEGKIAGWIFENEDKGWRFKR